MTGKEESSAGSVKQPREQASSSWVRRRNGGMPDHASHREGGTKPGVMARRA